MSDSDSGEGFGPQSTAGSADWRFYSQKEKDDRRGKVSDWLKENYVAADDVWILAELVYKHYREYCSQKVLDTATEKTFTRMMSRIFPNVLLCHVGAKRGQKNCYYRGIDVLKSSVEYENIIKGRKTNFDQRRSPPVKRKSTNQNFSADDDVKKSKIESEECTNLSSRETENCWKKCPSNYKEDHRKSTIEWLVGEYEVAPQICVLRTDVYQHYLDHCKKDQIAAAPQTIFGRILQKAFSKVAMRRLGGRGDSKYYYMGIDVRTSSDHYETVSVGRMVSVDNKPKKNSFTTSSR